VERDAAREPFQGRRPHLHAHDLTLTLSITLPITRVVVATNAAAFYPRRRTTLNNKILPNKNVYPQSKNDYPQLKTSTLNKPSLK
jgi:hypothetical protein